jgi:RHS repeat-associated protein
VEVNGSTVIGPVTDSTFTSGEASLWSYQPSSAGTHRFDNFSITVLGGGQPPAGKVLARRVLPQSAPTPAPNQVYRLYYYAGARRVAVRVWTGATGANDLYFLHSDHLGSTTVTTDLSQNIVGQQHYFAYGEPRNTSGTLHTDRRFTGQREETGLGSLYDYNARYYSPLMGRFISADSIVPEPGNPQDLNRYAYVLGNPVRYTDPSGHAPRPDNLIAGMFGIKFTGVWQAEHRQAVVRGVIDVAVKLASATPDNDTPVEAFRAVYGIDVNNPMIFDWDPNCSDCRPANCGGSYTGDCQPKFGHTDSTRRIEFASMSEDWRPDVRTLKQRNNVVHELGHAFENATVQTRADGSTYKPARSALPWTNREGLAEGGVWRQSGSSQSGEIFADMFVAWTYDTWSVDAQGQLTLLGSEYRQWMSQNMPLWVDLARGR